MAAESAVSAVFAKSETIDTPVCRGFEFTAEGPIDLAAMLDSYASCGFQASNVGKAIAEINQMLNFKFKPGELDEDSEKPSLGLGTPEGVKCRERECKIFLGVTSNLVSSGMREILKFICKHKMVDVICVTGGGVEEDLIKCLATTHLGEFNLDGAELRRKGLSLYFSAVFGPFG